MARNMSASGIVTIRRMKRPSDEGGSFALGLGVIIGSSSNTKSSVFHREFVFMIEGVVILVHFEQRLRRLVSRQKAHGAFLDIATETQKRLADERLMRTNSKMLESATEPQQLSD